MRCLTVRLCGITSRFQLLSPWMDQVIHTLLTRPPLSYDKIRFVQVLHSSASVNVQQAAFATGVLPNIYAFYRYTGNSACLSITQDLQFQMQPRS